MNEKAMILTDYHVQHVLRAYTQQLSAKSRISKDKLAKQAGQRDEVTISKESKKMLIIDKIAEEIISQLVNGSPRNETGKAILNRLSQEYGKPLDVTSEDGQGMVFRILSENNGGYQEYLSPEENKFLKDKLYEVTKSFIHEHLI
ncbi:MAG: hypothetical protein N3G78_06355 [Desulfobacterota bacterium]|nr:hypothetical protein [Thermodesulfobacteriota bacterium]